MKTSQRIALASLLQENDGQTVGLVKRQLIENGRAKLAEYHQMLRRLNGEARRNLEEVIGRLEEAESLGTMSRSLANLRTWSQFEELCWELARAEVPTFASEASVAKLDLWAGEVKALLRPGASDEEKVLCFGRHLGGTIGLSGNNEDYYSPRNCYLSAVLESRRGMPITLAIIYMLVGARIGIQVDGIGAPGHFLARIGNIIFDPYSKARILSEGDWELIAAEVPGKLRPFLTKACTPLQTMHRLLVNLRNCYVKLDDAGRRHRFDHYLAVLQR